MRESFRELGPHGAHKLIWALPRRGSYDIGSMSHHDNPFCVHPLPILGNAPKVYPNSWSNYLFETCLSDHRSRRSIVDATSQVETTRLGMIWDSGVRRFSSFWVARSIAGAVFRWWCIGRGCPAGPTWEWAHQNGLGSGVCTILIIDTNEWYDTRKPNLPEPHHPGYKKRTLVAHTASPAKNPICRTTLHILYTTPKTKPPSQFGFGARGVGGRLVSRAWRGAGQLLRHIQHSYAHLSWIKQMTSGIAIAANIHFKFDRCDSIKCVYDYAASQTTSDMAFTQVFTTVSAW
eukprot:482028-Amphidinium_carterae.1